MSEEHFNTNLTDSEYNRLRNMLAKDYTVVNIKLEGQEYIFLIPKWKLNKYFEEGFEKFVEDLENSNLYTMIKGGKKGYAIETNNGKIKSLIEAMRKEKELAYKQR
ncbi:MAG: hypothetical protein QXY61_03095 [Candidatus Anstonellales archaeon]